MQSGGLVPDAKNRVSQQLTSVAARIGAMEIRLAIRREALSKLATQLDADASAAGDDDPGYQCNRRSRAADRAGAVDAGHAGQLG